MNKEIKIYYLNTNELKPYDKNTRKHDDEDIKYIENSIKEFGFNDPIGVWGNDNIIVEGHGRLQAALNLGIEKVPCIRLDHMSEEQRKAYAIAHNKTAEMSEWDRLQLGSELKILEDDYDFTDFGFGDFEKTMLMFGDEFEPEPFDNEMAEEYEEVAEGYLAKKRVIITYNEETEPLIKKITGLEQIDKVVYDITELAK